MKHREEFDLEKFYNYSLDLFAVRKIDGTVVSVNPSFRRILGWSEEDLLGKNPFNLLHPEDLEGTIQEFNKLTSGAPMVSFQNRIMCSNGIYKFLSWTAFPDLQSDMIYITGRDITDLVESNLKNSQLATELKEANDKLLELASTDPLTKLKNRSAFHEELYYHILLAQKQEQTISLLMIDADHFKAFNDQFGHLEGDQVLVHLGNLLLRSTRKSDIVGRYGGEEFIIALPGASEKEAGTIAESIARTIRNFSWEKKNVTVSIGISTIQFHSNRGNENADLQRLLIEKADQALYQSKIMGRNRVTHHSSIDPKNLLSPHPDSDCSHTD
ncbi:sensor domain-containing diguanylate cyclase [Leptospira stimsonii]|uniref:diguanylate cyclase n=1 Tax=Leptospira stimsonii TaxID=2202203 RepID=A0ABY2MXT1_9LEPT|nr:sensor domain-containing diguanylate cyclase [Leptospira stimsonii]TGK19075.1 sensor domain-containing diguanylate cyclase [Leptospira stimsonii]TGM11057.1 sensor domain-containing diguanylate cyclase [Leptospira stimsonii]